jgi:Ca2+:H+ antiporter
MIICNGVIGLCVLLGAWRHREQSFRIEGFGSAYAALVALATLVLVLPAFTTSAPGAAYSPTQLVIVGASSLALWCVFVFFQTVRHRDYFLPAAGASNENVHAEPPTRVAAGTSLALLVVSLVAVVGLAKVLSPGIESAVERAGAPPAVVGIIISLVVLLPEIPLPAARPAPNMNLAPIGLATIGLTIPMDVAAAVFSTFRSSRPDETCPPAVTFVVGRRHQLGRTNLMRGRTALLSPFLFTSPSPRTTDACRAKLTACLQPRE